MKQLRTKSIRTKFRKIKIFGISGIISGKKKKANKLTLISYMQYSAKLDMKFIN